MKRSKVCVPGSFYMTHTNPELVLGEKDSALWIPSHLMTNEGGSRSRTSHAVARKPRKYLCFTSTSKRTFHHGSLHVQLLVATNQVMCTCCRAKTNEVTWIDVIWE